MIGDAVQGLNHVAGIVAREKIDCFYERTGVAILSYLGAEIGKKILGQQNRVISFDGQDFPTKPFYTGNPWFLPMVGNWYRFRDWLDRRLA